MSIKSQNNGSTKNKSIIPNESAIGDVGSSMTTKAKEKKSGQFTRFADYFVICGLDLDQGLEVDKFAGDNLHCSPLDRAYKSKPLAHYPENVDWNPFDYSGICMLSLPSGLRFRTQKHNIEPKFHSYATTREDGKRCYGFSLIFYEEVRNRNICSAIHTLQSMFLTELSSGQTPPGIRKVKESPVSRSLPRHFKIASNAPASAGYYDVTKDKLYVAKCISLVCQGAYAHVAELFLTNLYKCLPRHPGPGLSIESYVYNILYEITIPQPGQSIRVYVPPPNPHLPPIATIIQRPSIENELPLLDFPLRLMFQYLGVECVVQLYTCVLLENQVLLRSLDYQKLMIVAECMSALLFPFTWQHVYAPILPAALHHFLDAPVPYIMGLNTDSESNVKISDATLCLVDIDKKTVQMPEELPPYPHKNDFMTELLAILDKYQIPRDKSLDPPSTLNPKNLMKEHDMMTSSCTLPSGMHIRRKHSLHDVLDWDRPGSPDIQTPLITPPQQQNQRIVDIVRRSGVGMDEADNEQMPPNKRQTLSIHEQYCEDLRLNNHIREIFLNRFVQMFVVYEQYVILPNQDKEEWLTNRESLHNFDKASFLSDQPQHHRPFLSRFLESQMFATLIDNKIMSSWDDEVDPNLHIFDGRIKFLRKRYGGESMIRAANYEPCILARDTQRLLDKRLATIDLEVAPPTEILNNRPSYFRSFPILEKSVLNQECASRGNSLRRLKNGAKWRVKDINIDGKSSTDALTDAQNGLPPHQPSHDEKKANRNSANLSSIDISPAQIAQANWTFIEKLLKDCKSKTKRMLLEKMNLRELELSGDVSGGLLGVEENTLIASLCDLLEKVWSHGLQNKQGKSALWTHLTNYLDIQECQNPSSQIDRSYLAPDLSSLAIEPAMEPSSPTRGRTKSRDRKSLGPEQLRPLPDIITFDIKNILAMTDIKTPIGYSRAFVRLALEKKLLSRHLKSLLSDTALIRSLYKRSAFLRCEEEKEQFLYHLLTLNAVDYFCFTNTYPTTKLPYRLVIFPSKKPGGSTTSANVWVAVSGHLCETQQINVPRHSLEFVFHHKNLGVLTSLRIGHDDSGLTAKLLVENCVVRNEVTGHTYKFPCGRWLGRGIDDNAVERLLIGQLVPRTVDSEVLIESCRTPPRTRSPSVHRPEIRPQEIQSMIGDCVNAIVKWHYKPSRDRDVGSLTNLLCGEDGLVKSLEQVFLCGFRSTRLFGKNLYIWDYFVRVKEQFESSLIDESLETVRGGASSPPSSSSSPETQYSALSPAIRQELSTIYRCYCHLMDEIHKQPTLGKDGRFQLFICLTLREHLLTRMLLPMSQTKCTLEMYDEQSFMRKKGLLTFLRQILEPLDEFHIILENSITQGISSQC